jgi:hypothetical protein
VILGDRSAARSAGTRPGRAGHQTPIREFSIGTFRENSSGTDTNQLRLWFSSFAYVLLEALRRIGLPHTELAQATCGSIRLKLLKLGARVTVSVRRIKIAIASACPHHAEFALAHARLRAPPG